MTILEDQLRSSLRSQAAGLRVPDRPALDRDVAEVRRGSRPRWLAAAACLALIVTGVVAVLQRRAADPEPVPPAAPVVPDSTVPESPAPSLLPDTTLAASPVPTQPVDSAPTAFLGTWVATDIFGAMSTMVLVAAEDDSVEMLVDDFVRVCSAGSTMTGTGRLRAESELVFGEPVLTCDDGSKPQTLSSSPLEEDLENLTFTRDPATDILTDDFGQVWTREGADPSLGPTPPPVDAATTQLLNGFIESRLAGDGAQQYLNAPEADIPLLYSTSAGARYERGEFEQVVGIEWPYGFTAFIVRLFAADRVVEQLFFTPAAGRMGLEYEKDGFGTDIAPTTENRQPVARRHDSFDGEVTVHAAHPWVSTGTDRYLRLIPQGADVAPTTDGGQRNDWDELFLVADPRVDPKCQLGGSPTDAEALAERIRSEPDFGATAPIAVSVGGVAGLRLDLAIPAGTTVCARETIDGDLFNPVFDRNGPHDVRDGVMTGRATGELMRLYLFDAPDGSSMRILAVAIVAPEETFERAVEAAAPIVESLSFSAG
jgi:hypothetical protein